MNTTTKTLSILATLMLAACGTPADMDSMDDTDTMDTDDTMDTEVDLAMPRGADNPPTLGAQIDRTGRPAISTATVLTFSGDDDARNTARDAYNSDGPSAWSDWTDEIMGSLAILDALDATCGNQLSADASDDRYAFLAGVLADDQLYVRSTSGTCGTYLGLEGEIVGALAADAGGCGGRMPSDDVIERSYSVLAAGVLVGVDDGVIADDATVSTTFPYLAAPQ